MDDLGQELAALRVLIERQQDRIAELEGQARRTLPQEVGTVPNRRQVLATAAAVVAGSAALATSSSPAQAGNGASLVVGSYNNNETLPCALTYAGPSGDIDGTIYGFGVVDQTLDAFRTSAGIAGHTQGSFAAGVLGHDTSVPPGAIGVSGYSKNGIGVFGGGENVAIHARGRRRGVTGLTYGAGPGSIGVYAGDDTNSSNTPTALLVDGVFRARRAGRILVPAGVRTRVVSINPLTDTSLVLATAQRAVGEVAVQAVILKITPPQSFTIRLNQIAPAGGMPVAWLVIDSIGTALD